MKHLAEGACGESLQGEDWGDWEGECVRKSSGGMAGHEKISIHVAVNAIRNIKNLLG